MRRWIWLLAAVLAGAVASASAQAEDTLRAVLSNGIILSTEGHAVAIQYHEDGTYSGVFRGVAFEGLWRVEGAEICTMSSMSPIESCIEYPAGKKPGDVFEVTSPSLGVIDIRIIAPS